MRFGSAAFAFVVALALTACGGSSPSPAAPPSAELISVGGSYATQVTPAENNCGPVTVQSMPTSVAHTPGASRLSLTHAGVTHSGSLNPDGSFQTEPLQLSGANESLTLAITGRFNRTGFEAVVGVDVRPQQTAACRYNVRWVGTKQGAPNVLP